jgi:serine/threonine-protein kinase
MPDSLADREARVDAALADYLRALDRGEAIPRDEFLAHHTDLAIELGEALDDLARFKVIDAPRDELGDTPSVNRQAETATFDPSATPAPVEHVTLVPDYRLLAELARGGMGVVYRCHDPSLDRDLAVKVLQPQFMSRPEIVRRFLEEARIAGQLQHPGVVPIHAVGRTDDGRPFFTMKLVRGRTLADLLSERPDASHDLPRFLKVFEQIAQTIAFAHSSKVIHRDLKPGNVMVGAFGEVQVMDWGLAKQKDEGGRMKDEVRESPDLTNIPRPPSLTQTGTVIGTPSYMSPEQARGETDRLDERADVFGLGAILCEILTGHPPFEGPDRMDVVFTAQRGDLSTATARLTKCGADEDLRRLAIRCLSPAPADRPQSAAEVADAVTAYLTGVQERLQAAEMERAAAQARAVAAVRARRLGIALAVTVMGLLTLGLGGWFWIDRDRAMRTAAELQSLSDRTKRAEEELDRAVQLRDDARAAGDDVGKWAEALAAAKRAEGYSAGEGLPAELRERVTALVSELDTEKHDRELIDRLREARLQAAEVENDKFDSRPAVTAYAAAFRGASVDDSMPPDAVAHLLAGKPISEHLAAALFDWGRMQPDQQVRQRLFDAADATDPEPERVRLRKALARRDLPELRRMIASINVVGTPPLTIRLLADALAVAAAPIVPSKAKDVPTIKDAANDLASAIALLRKGQAQYPQDFWLNHQLAFWLMRPGQQANLDDAIRFYTAAVSTYRRSPGAYLNLAAALARRNRVDDAIDAVNEAIRLKPDYAMARSNLASYLLIKNQPVEALEQARLAVGHNSSAAHTRLALGRALLANDKAAEAVPELQAATRFDARNRLGWSELGKALTKIGLTDDAIAAHEEAIKIDDRIAADLVAIAVLLRQKERFDDAVKLLNRAAQHSRPNDPEIQKLLNETWQQKGKATGAIPDLKEVVARNPQDVETLLKLAKLEMDAGQSKSCLMHYGMAQQQRPNDPAIQAAVGRANLQLANYDAAVRALRTARRLKNDDFDICLDLGRAESEAGFLIDAVKTLEEASRMKPDNPWAYHHLSRIHERRGNYPAALEAHHQAAARRRNVIYYFPRSAEEVAELTRLSELTERCAAVLRGEAKLDPKDRILFARICAAQEKYASAVRFYLEAFDDDPKPLEDPQAAYRIVAAASAVRAGLGRGADAANLSAKERAALRRRAMEFLSTEVAAMEKKMAMAGQEEFFATQAAIRSWGGESLFGERQFDLGAFPPGEREEWQQLWEKADDLANRAYTKR